MADLLNCPICKLKLSVPASHHTYSGANGGLKDGYEIKCKACGHYYGGITFVRLDETKLNGRRHLLSAAVRRWSNTGETVEIHMGNFEELISRISAPASIVEAMLSILEYVDANAPNFAAGVTFDLDGDHALFALKAATEFVYALEQLTVVDYLTLLQSIDSKRLYRIKPKGSEKLLENRQKRPNSNQAFVARWFDDDGEMEAIERQAIFPALRENGYEPKSEAGERHNKDVTLSIIGNIRKSSLVIADFTGHRPNVYWEAGFARALGIEVIHCVKSDDVQALAFDTRQIKHIVWQDADDLKKQLSDWISATAPITQS